MRYFYSSFGRMWQIEETTGNNSNTLRLPLTIRSCARWSTRLSTRGIYKRNKRSISWHGFRATWNPINSLPDNGFSEGQTLFVIEPQPYKDKVTQAEANVESSKSKLAYTKASYERMQEAVKTKAISEIDYLQAQSDYGEALAAYEEARSQLSLANIDLSYCIVKAPFTGRISRNMVDPGNMVGTDASNSALATIYKDNQMYLYFNMAYPDFARLPKNTPSALLVTIQDVNNPEKT